MEKITYAIAGLFAGIVLVLSCGDDSPSRADAATCDCPLAEPPIEARIVEVIERVTLPPSSMNGGRFGTASAACPDNSILIAGGCIAGEGQTPDILIEQNSMIPRSAVNKGNVWKCTWRNNTNQGVEARAVVRCLMAAP